MIRAHCFRCQRELDLQGALVFSPPRTNLQTTFADKYHICVSCWKMLLAWLEEKQ